MSSSESTTSYVLALSAISFVTIGAFNLFLGSICRSDNRKASDDHLVIGLSLTTAGVSVATLVDMMDKPSK